MEKERKTTINKKNTNRKKTASAKRSTTTKKASGTKRQSNSKRSAKRKKTQSRSGLAPFLLFVFIILAGIYLYRGYQIKDSFFNGITINHLDVRGMTVEEVEQALSQRASSYQLTVTGREGASATITSTDIGYGYVSDGTIQQLFDKQNWIFWGLGYLGGNALKEAREVTVAMTYDKEMLLNCMNSWNFLQADQQIPPKDAYISYENGEYVIISDASGTALDSSILYEHLTAAVNTTASVLNIEDTGAYIGPSIAGDNEILQKNLTILNTYANCTVQHKLPNDESKGIYPDTLRSWLTVDSDGLYHYDEDVFLSHIDTYVYELKNQIERLNQDTVSFYGQDRKWHTISKFVVLNWVLDTVKEKDRLKEEILSQTSITREPVYVSRARAATNALAATYVEIDLTGQHLWYYENGSIILDCDITSGTVSDPERKTPEGLYKIQYKERDRILRGNLLPDGTYEYESPVTYWMPFNGGIGLHDASWRDPNGFGGSYYINDGSHGCINMPTKAAQALYERIEKGCLVACYY